MKLKQQKDSPENKLTDKLKTAAQLALERAQRLAEERKQRLEAEIEVKDGTKKLSCRF